jgi:hypothetical protein
MYEGNSKRLWGFGAKVKNVLKDIAAAIYFYLSF